MKNLFSVLTVVGLIVICTSCSSNNPKAVLSDFLSAYESYCADMAKAESGDDVLEALDKATAKMKDMIPRMNQLTKQYPEIKGLEKGASLPDVFKEFQSAFAALRPMQMKAIGHAGSYLKDPRVKESQKKFIEVMNMMIDYQEIEYVDLF
jgi:hypothetical protein